MLSRNTLFIIGLIFITELIEEKDWHKLLQCTFFKNILF